MNDVACGACGSAIAQSSDTPIDERITCQSCGSMARTINVQLDGAITFHSSLDLKVKRGGRGRPALHLRTGDDLTRSTGRWARLDRIIDRENDRYAEHIEDAETGRVLRHVDEPLSSHRGRGSARSGKSGR